MFLLGFGGETFIPGEDPGRAESWGQASQFHPQKSNHCPVCRGGEVYYSHKYPSVYLVFWTLITIFIDIYSGQLSPVVLAVQQFYSASLLPIVANGFPHIHRK